jgi:hypothetical protein
MELPKTITVNKKTFYLSPLNPVLLSSYTHLRATKRATYLRKRGRGVVIKKLRCPDGRGMKYIFVLYERRNLDRQASGPARGAKQAATAAMAGAVRAAGTIIHGGGVSKPDHMDADEWAEYKMGAEYAHEVSRPSLKEPEDEEGF